MPPAVDEPPRRDLEAAGGVCGFAATPGALLILHALVREEVHREVDVLWPSGLLCVAALVVAGGVPCGLAGAALVRRVRPGWGDRRPRVAAFGGGYLGGLVGFPLAAAAVAAALVGVAAG